MILGKLINLVSILTDQYALLLVANTGYTASSVAQAVAQLGLAKSIKIVTAALWAQAAAWAATPIGIIAIATASIYGLVKATNAINNSTKKHYEGFSELRSEYKEAQSEVESLNNELKTTEERISELESLKELGTISLAEADELERLKEANRELERKILLYEKMAEIKADEAMDKFIATMDSDKKDRSSNINYDEQFMGYGVLERKYLKSRASEYNPYKDLNEQALEEYKKYREKHLQAQDDYNKAESDKERTRYEKLMDSYQKSMDREKSYLDERFDFYKKAIEGTEYFVAKEGEELTAQQKEYNLHLDYINDFLNRYLLLTGKPDVASKVFDNVYNSSKFSEAKTALEKLGKTGELTSEKIKKLYDDNDSVKELIDYLIELGLLDFDNLDGLANQINDIGDKAKTTGESISNGIDTLIDKLNKGRDALKSLSDAMADFGKDGELTYSSIVNIADKFSDVKGIDMDDYINRLYSHGFFK